MKLKSEFNQLLIKYVLLLAILYFIQLLGNYGARFILKGALNNVESLVKNSIPLLVLMWKNLVALIFVLKDMRKYAVKNKYLPWLTLFFCPLGICILLIQLHNESVKEV